MTDTQESAQVGVKDLLQKNPLLGADAWDRMAVRYHNFEALTGAFAAQAVSLVAGNVRAHGGDGTLRVLDVAAGTGVAARAVVAQLGAKFPKQEVTATDISEQMLSRCADRWRGEPATASVPLSTMVADMQGMPEVASGSQDLVLVIFGIMFAADTTAVLREIMRALAPGGVAVVTTWHFNSMTLEIAPSLMRHFGKLTSDAEEDEFVTGVMRFGRENVMCRMLRAAGLKVGTADMFAEGRCDAFIEFQRADPVPLTIEVVTEMFDVAEPGEKHAFVRAHFSEDGATVPTRGTALTVVLRRPAAPPA